MQSKRLFELDLEQLDFYSAQDLSDHVKVLPLQKIRQFDDVFKRQFLSIWLKNISLED